MSAIHLYTAKCRYRVESKSVAVWGTQVNVRQSLEALFWQNKEHLGLQISFINFVRLYLYPLPPPSSPGPKATGNYESKDRGLSKKSAFCPGGWKIVNQGEGYTSVLIMQQNFLE